MGLAKIGLADLSMVARSGSILITRRGESRQRAGRPGPELECAVKYVPYLERVIARRPACARIRCIEAGR
jgi:hypothetical protein